MFAGDLTILFKDRVATGEYAWAPSSGVLPTGEGDDDVYRPSLDLEEGSGDSEEDLQAAPTGASGGASGGASAGISSDFLGMNLDNSQSQGSDRSQGKRKRIGPSEGNKKQKGSNSRHISDAVSVIANTYKAQVNKHDPWSVDVVMDELDKIEAIKSDRDLYPRCCELLLDKTRRKMFMKLKHDEQGLLDWLRLNELMGDSSEDDFDSSECESDSSEDELNEVVKTTVLVGLYAAKYLCKEPRRTSEYTGRLWVNDILNGHHVRCSEMFRMQKDVFIQLCTELVELGLKETKGIGIPEMVAMFLHVVGHGVGNRNIQERFQRSGETISRNFHKVLKICLKLAMKYIRPHDSTFQDIPAKIRNDRRYWPFFRNAIGAIDGTHIHCVVNPSQQPRFIGRKGEPTQNVMAVCDWDMCFIFALPGWEGTAHDARIFENALTTPSMNFPHPPPGKYYLVDAGYPTPTGYLGPYRCERYHLPDFRRSNGFANNNEVFNYRHSSLRCTIERTFGVWKNRFAILRKMPKYPFKKQVQIVCATMALHNFIRRNSDDDRQFNMYENENIALDENGNHVDDNQAASSSSGIVSSREMDYVRDSIRDQLVAHLQDN